MKLKLHIPNCTKIIFGQFCKLYGGGICKILCTHYVKNNLKMNLKIFLMNQLQPQSCHKLFETSHKLSRNKYTKYLAYLFENTFVRLRPISKVDFSKKLCVHKNSSASKHSYPLFKITF